MIKSQTKNSTFVPKTRKSTRIRLKVSESTASMCVVLFGGYIHFGENSIWWMLTHLLYEMCMLWNISCTKFTFFGLMTPYCAATMLLLLVFVRVWVKCSKFWPNTNTYTHTHMCTTVAAAAAVCSYCMFDVDIFARSHVGNTAHTLHSTRLFTNLYADSDINFRFLLVFFFCFRSSFSRI